MTADERKVIKEVITSLRLSAQEAEDDESPSLAAEINKAADRLAALT